MRSIGVAATFYNEVNALPGFLEMASQFFDDILLIDCGPQGRPSDDGSLDILSKWGVKWGSGSIDMGFGIVRTNLIRSSKTDWVVVMDCDERMLRCAPVLKCSGTDRYPDVQSPNLLVTRTGETYDQKDFLLTRIDQAEGSGCVAVRACRRHWLDTSLKRPAQNWERDRDWQLRIMKRSNHIGYRAEVRMHEQAWDFRANAGPRYVEDHLVNGPFYEHLHCHFKPMEPEQRQHDIRIYDAIHAGRTPE